MILQRTFVTFLTITTFASAQWKDLWPGEAPGAPRPPAGTEKVGDGGRVTDVEVPQYMLYQPEEEKATGAAVVILPGGGYTIDAMDHEGHQIGKWLAERGILGLVVKYRVTGQDALQYGYPVPFLDARRALRTARANADEWHLDPKKIGVMGFSAGGHLASLCTTRFADHFEQETEDATDQQNCRPDFAILIYPVITLKNDLTHAGSRRRLLGGNPSEEMVEKLSTQNAVTEDTPPVFLLSTADDGVDCRNSLNFAIACKAHQVPVSLHLFESGGHGYGLGGKGDLAAWPSLLDTWLKRVVK